MRKGCSRIFAWGLVFAAAAALCLGVWAAGFYVFGLPTAAEHLGEPAPDLGRIQESYLTAILLANEPNLLAPIGDESLQTELIIQQGETADRVVQQMRELGLIDNDRLLLMYLRYRGFDRGIQAGKVAIRGGMSLKEVAEALQSAAPLTTLLTVPEGWRIEEIAERIDQLGLPFTGDDFLSAAQQAPLPPGIAGAIPDGRGAEGFLFPDTYPIEDSATAQSLVQAMLMNFDERVDSALRAGFDAQALTLYQAVTLASIVEREAIVPEERPWIASVFLNRLRLGMNLEADPTVQYALGKQADGAWWKAPLTADDLSIDSPYNTYRYAGLPAGPIANPGLDSLRAVGFPEPSEYLYFRATCDGSGRHAFAVTYEEHLQHACP